MFKDQAIRRNVFNLYGDEFLIFGLRGMAALFGGARNLAKVLCDIMDIFDTGVRPINNFRDRFMALYELVNDIVIVDTSPAKKINGSRVGTRGKFSFVNNGIEQYLTSSSGISQRRFQKRINRFLKLMGQQRAIGSPNIIVRNDIVTADFVSNVKILLDYLFGIVDFPTITNSGMISLQGQKNTYYVNTNTGIIARRDIPGASIVYL